MRRFAPNIVCVVSIVVRDVDYGVDHRNSNIELVDVLFRL